MFPVLDLKPMVASAWPVDALTMLGDQTLQPHPAGRLEQLGTDLALLERRHEDALGPPAEQLRQVGLARCSGSVFYGAGAMKKQGGLIRCPSRETNISKYGTNRRLEDGQ